ncbi:MAG: mechanosensitive ion channel family protein [Alphaproteobacteria bacterium]|nr:mechanosensitive ion channel family protein [Alphaproteobacteria bacterium]
MSAIDITPLLAGAGIIGLAVGFGAQTLVKDFITGLFILLEDTLSVGDVVTVGTHTGAVEAFTIRTLRLRDGEGRVHSIPFSEVTSIINLTKNFAYVLIEVGVSYDADLQKVMEIMKQIGDELRKEPAFSHYIYENAEVFGIERFDASSIAMRARIKTNGHKQWDIKREYLIRLKRAFDKEGIEIPFPITTSIHRAHSPADAPLVEAELKG